MKNVKMSPKSNNMTNKNHKILCKCVLLYQCNRTPYSKLHSNLAVPETSKIIAPMQCYKTFKIFAGFYYVQGCQRDTVNQTMRWAILYVFMMVKIRL